MNGSHAWMHSLDRWDDLRYFLACVREGSFSAAARALRVEQSTVSRRIGALEKLLGGTLFKRTPEGVKCTPLADRVYVEAQAVEAHMAAILSQAKGEEVQPVGAVRIAITESMALHLLLPRLVDVVERYPDLRYEIITGVQSSDLVRGEAEIALRFVKPTRGDLVAKKVATLAFCVLTHPTYWAKYGERTWKEHRWLTVEFPFLEVVERMWFETHIATAPWLVASSYLPIFEALNLGLGISLMPKSAQAVFPELLEVDVPFPLPTALDLWLVTHQALRRTARISAIWDELEAMCEGLF